MNGAVLTLVVAVVGVAGTLASALLTQRGATKAKRMELEYAERQRATDREIEERRIALETRRACYVKLHQAIRHYQAMLYNHVHTLLREATSDEQCAELEAARYSVRDAYAEALMAVFDDVMDQAVDLAARLDVVYRLVKRFDSGVQDSEDSLDDARRQLKDVSDGIRSMRRLMRADLGIAECEPPSAGDS
ncbi:hypothetical protein ACQEVY_00390 [Streptomyces sp. CA-288835]|uniref:hypothetical protein n=1 Tax=Streptomyces sp. CA-288835 TaxID=3240069 RepID=UPI003D8EF5B4